MYWLVLVAGLYLGRSHIAKFLAPYLQRLDEQMIVFYGHSVVVSCGLLYILPIDFIGLEILKRPTYLICFWCSIAIMGYTVKVNYGFPTFPANLGFSNWKEGLQAVAPYMQNVLSKSVDFHFLFFALIFVAAYPSVFALVILWRRSLFAVATHVAKHERLQGRVWRTLEPHWNKTKQPQTAEDVKLYSALAEILLGFWLTASLFMPTRQILTCILYWNYLKTRFQVPRSKPDHARAWGRIKNHVDPALSMVPFLNKPLSYAQQWFNKA